MWGGPPFGTGPQQFGGHFNVRGGVGADVGRGNVGEGVRWIVGGGKTGRNNKVPKPKPHFDEASSLRRCEVSVLVPCCSGPFFSAHDPSHSLSDVSLARHPPRRPLAHQSGRQTVAVRFRRAGRPTSPLPSPCAFWERLWLKKTKKGRRLQQTWQRGYGDPAYG